MHGAEVERWLAINVVVESLFSLKPLNHRIHGPSWTTEDDLIDPIGCKVGNAIVKLPISGRLPVFDETIVA